ncbi:response regulator [Caulobacter sp. 17J65-9]|uniref:response regulator n=1 Tax=Caulobacter sp. 17J65-9 TaxID=2709382 RepID=UPI0013C99060|nr:response regulator [Caulobacter sp. 17J65-9]NEX94035.1 response regulator [Caulobacter sp. 17J65-9]
MKTCLVVDDSRIIRKIARRILEDFAFDVAEAGDGAEALARCRAHMPDVVLLDWRMPVMDGLAFLKSLRAEPGGERPKVVFCTSENEPERISEALDAGADEYVMKPFDGDILGSKLTVAGVV